MAEVDVTHYEVLGVSNTASTDEIKTAYRRMLRQTHPDTGGNAALFRLVQNAWDVLGDDSKRKFYDGLLSGPKVTYSSPPTPPSAAEKTWEEALRDDEPYVSKPETGHKSSTSTPPPPHPEPAPAQRSKRSWTEIGFDVQPQKDKLDSLNYILWWGSAFVLGAIGYFWGVTTLWEQWNADNSNGVAGFFAVVVAFLPGAVYGVGGYGLGFILVILTNMGFFFYKLKRYSKQ